MRNIKWILSLISILYQFDVSAQKDTLFVKYKEFSDSGKIFYLRDTHVLQEKYSGYILSGNCILPGTSGQMRLTWGSGLHLIKVEKSECQNNRGEPKFKPDQVQTVIETDSSLMIEIQIMDNCCYNFLCDAEVVDSNVIKLKYIGYGSYCACNCCFGLNWYFKKMKEDEIYDFVSIQKVMLNEDKKTLKSIPRSKN